MDTVYPNKRFYLYHGRPLIRPNIREVRVPTFSKPLSALGMLSQDGGDGDFPAWQAATRSRHCASSAPPRSTYSRIGQVLQGCPAPPAYPGAGIPMSELRVHAPVEPRQIFCAGVNNRQRVIDLAMIKHRRAKRR
jgi:hypothetical protein